MSTAAVAALLGTALAGSYGLIALVIAHRFTTARRVTPPDPPMPHRARFTRTRFPARRDALTLSAWYARADAPQGAIILVHGRDACRGDELRGSTFDLAIELMDAGFSILMLDLRGHGESDRGRLTFGRHEARDILGAVDFLLARGYQPARIGVLGASMGGASAIVAAAHEPAIGALVTDSAFADFGEVLRLQFSRLTHLPAIFLSGAALAARALTGEQLLRHTTEHDMRALSGRPILVIHAVDDPFVPVTHAHVLARAGEGTLWITAGDRHLASFGAARAEYHAMVREFFAHHLRPGAIG
jgi:pimeloyl-ACP methyl ester carboxylesterase